MKLALFDFDETLIHENSLGYLFKTVSQKRFLFPDVLSLALNYKTYRQGVKYSIKRRLYRTCLAGVSEQTLYAAGQSCTQVLHPIEPVVEKLYQLKRDNHVIWIVTATPPKFVEGVVQSWGWPIDEVIGTQLDIQAGVYTGTFCEECIKEEKTRRINERILNQQLEPSIEVAYGNLPVDIPMMSLAKERFAITGEKIIFLN